MAERAGEWRFHEYVRNNLRWNFAVNLWDITFIMFSSNLVSQSTIMPLLVQQLTDSKFAVGLVPAVFSLCYLLPQLLTASYAERLPRKKPFVMWLGGLGERGPNLFIGLMLLWFGRSAPGLALVLFFLLLGISAASNGIASPAWYDMIAKVIPRERRGLWAGMGHSLGGLLGMAGAALAGRILDRYPFPDAFAYLFLLAFVAGAISWIGLALNREPENVVVKSRIKLRSYLRRLPAVLHRDHNFRRFLIARSVVNLGTMAVGFFAVYSVERYGLAGGEVGLLTAILAASQALFNPLWGMVADRLGHKTTLCIVAFGTGLATLVTWLAPAGAWMRLAFALLGISMASDSVSRMNIVFEFCAPEDRPTYVGLANTLLAPTKTLAPIVGGWMAQVSGYRLLFLVAVLVSLFGGLLMAMIVHEPRRVQQEVARAG